MDNQNPNQEMENLLNQGMEELNPTQTPVEGQPEEAPEDIQKPQEQTPPVSQPTTNEDTNPMRQLRNQYDKTNADLRKREELLNKLTQARGFKSIEELEKSIIEEENKRIATQKGIPVEVQQELAEYKSRLQTLEQQRMEENFNMRAHQLIAEHKLDETSFGEFAQKAVAAGFKITDLNVDLGLIYKAMYLESIIATEIEKAKQGVLANIQTQHEQSPVIDSNRRVVTPETKKEDLAPADLVAQLFKQF